MVTKYILKNKFYILSLIIFIFGCSTNDIANYSTSIEDRFNSATVLFEEDKFSKAKDEFQYIINNNPGSKISMHAQFYLAECLYYLNKYDQAINEYNRYIFVSQNPELIEKSKFSICKSYYYLSSAYNKDQESSTIALDRFQYFIEQYPNSIYKTDCENIIKKIRNKLARKDLESGRLYLRMEEYDSGIVYFEAVVSNYYDTPYYDDALVNIILALVLKGEVNEANKFFENNEDEFSDKDNVLLAKNIINDKMNLIEYFNLLK